MQSSLKAAPMLGLATLAVLGLAAVPAMAQTDTVTSFSKLQDTYGPATTDVPGHYADKQNNSGATVGDTSVSISSQNYAADTNGSTGSALLHTDTFTTDKPSAAFEDFLKAPVTLTTGSTITFTYKADGNAVPTLHLYFSDGSSNPFYANIYTNVTEANSTPDADGWYTFTADANNTLWTEHSAGGKYLGFHQSGDLTQVLSDVSALGSYSLYGIGVTNQDHAGDIYISSVSVAGQTVNFATPEPSSVAAFAFTGLGALGLMLRARKRKSSAV